MIHTAKLDLDRYPEIGIEFEVFSYLYDHGYPIDIDELYSVVNQKPQDENSGYLAAKVTTTKVPLDEADVANDEIQKWVCSCPAYQFQVSVDLDEQSIEDWGHCKHLKDIDKVVRAKEDDSQATL